jgi:hypothetical protein
VSEKPPSWTNQRKTHSKNMIDVRWEEVEEEEERGDS